MRKKRETKVKMRKEAHKNRGSRRNGKEKKGIGIIINKK